MLNTIVIIVVLLVAAVLLYAASRPNTFAMQRSTVIAASPEKVFRLISDLKAFNTWNPFALKEPTAKIEYEGAANGPGAAYSWQGKAMGSGRLEVVEVVAPTKVVMRLDFKKPMQATNRVEFTLAPQGAQATQVTWAMTGPMPYVSKLMTTFVSMDKMMGGEFEAGLANLKTAAQAR
jgi:uncharacterized protein YndB with AHSA1/START domain